jgi:hypothetical protein
MIILHVLESKKAERTLRWENRKNGNERAQNRMKAKGSRAHRWKAVRSEGAARI